MLSHISLAALGMALTLVINTPALAASGKSSTQSTTQTKDEEKAAKELEKAAKEKAKETEKASKEAEKAEKEKQKAAEKAAKDAEKAQKQDRIELIAKMKAAEVNDEDVSEDEASLKYRSKSGKIKLTAEIEGFSDGDIFNMYVVIENKEVLVANMELISEGDIARQEIEFDEATWPVGVPKVLSVGTAVKVRSAAGELVLEGSLQNK